ncbi:flavin-containing amine oxidasedehydrogenase-like protein [Coleophoma cylindrospora]|uniref:Flavin-containing amine oxidasedehydrogenase-like protein n=1 Tax=Coleophoma cylindrospora TaxID=1849047 RepID=A0A3D8SSZ1_9HELO|nr:flavin-containing amine oxidasedehydrogenase-like protein [Coleophoma cylindrospora]
MAATNGHNGERERDQRKHVVIIGAGAAGMSCASTLSQHPEKFKVTMIERMAVCGGQATSISIDKSRFGTDWMNDGVQGGSPVREHQPLREHSTKKPKIFKHTFNFFKTYGYVPQEVKLQVSFGKGTDGFWTNCFPSKLIEQFSGDIKKFGRVLNIIRWTMPILGIVPVRIMLRMFFFSKDFGDKMVYPLIALFLGTGNQTANVSCAILERLFNDPNMKLWDYDPETLLPNLPTMVTFPNLHNFYEDFRKDLEKKGVEIRLQTDVTEILERSDDGIVLKTRPFDPDANDRRGVHTGSESRPECFDELVMCVLADDALKLLGKTATFREKLVLGGAKFFDDITVTHCDTAYFQKHYETEFNPKLCAEPKSKAQEEQIAFSKGEMRGEGDEPSGFRPMYYTKTYRDDPKKIEMSFDVTNYQHQFRMDHQAETAPLAYDHHVFQSIFLDKTNRQHWTMDEIDESKIIDKKCPWVRFVLGEPGKED